MARSRRADPDYVTDADRGSSGVPSTKRAAFMDESEHQERAEIRAGARDLDTMVEQSPSLTRQQRDRERAMPRDVTEDVPYPQMERILPVPDSIRHPLSSRQRKARSITKRGVQERLPDTQQTAMYRLVGQPQRWQDLNDALSDAAGDVQDLDDSQRIDAQRIDRGIQAYERANDRGHVVYTNVEMPAMINHSNLAGFTRNNFESGDEITFDRFTAGAQTLHEMEPDAESGRRTAVFEIQTRRGMYLGRSDSVDDTAHLLPRGIRLWVVGTHLARYRGPDGSEGRRQVIQLTDTDPN